MERNPYVLRFPVPDRMAGLTVVLRSPVQAFTEVRAGLRLPLGLRIPLRKKHCTIVLLTGAAFPENGMSSISLYLTRTGARLLRRCPANTCLELRFCVPADTSAGMEIRPRFRHPGGNIA